jgi:hypothetical protein
MNFPIILAHGDGLGANDELLVTWTILNVIAYMGYTWWKSRRAEAEDESDDAPSSTAELSNDAGAET